MRGKLHSRGKGKRADYVLYHKPNQPIALIEAKDPTHDVGAGMQQRLDYAETRTKAALSVHYGQVLRVQFEIRFLKPPY